MRDLIARTPLSLGSLALGFAALGILLEPFLGALHGACSLAAVLLVTLVGARVALAPSTARRELGRPGQASLAAAVPMALMLVAVGLPSWAVGAAFALWLAAALGSVALMGWIVATALRRRRLPEALPTAFVGIGGIGVAALTAPAFGLHGLGYGLFWAAFVGTLASLVVVGVHCAVRPLDDEHRPLACLYALPMSVGLLGYLTCCPVPEPLFVAVMLGLSQGLLALGLAPLPRMAGRPFSVGFSVLTVPFALTALAVFQALPFLEASGVPVPPGLYVLSLVEIGFAVAMTVVVGAYCARELGREARVARAQALTAAVAGEDAGVRGVRPELP